MRAACPGAGGEAKAESGRQTPAPAAGALPSLLRPGRPSHAACGAGVQRPRCSIESCAWRAGPLGGGSGGGWGEGGKLSAETPSPTPEALARKPRV